MLLVDDAPRGHKHLRDQPRGRTGPEKRTVPAAVQVNRGIKVNRRVIVQLEAGRGVHPL